MRRKTESLELVAGNEVSEQAIKLLMARRLAETRPASPHGQ